MDFEVARGSNVCISQSVSICSSGHDFRTKNLEYRHKPVVISDGSWICLKAIVLPGSNVGKNSVISAGEVFYGELPSDHIVRNNEQRAIDYDDN